MPQSEKFPQQQKPDQEDMFKAPLSGDEENPEALFDYDGRENDTSALEDVMAEAQTSSEQLSRDIEDKQRAAAIKRLMKVDRNALRELRESGKLDTMTAGELALLALERDVEVGMEQEEQDAAAARHAAAREKGFHKTDDEKRLEAEVAAESRINERSRAAWDIWNKLADVVDELSTKKIGWFAKPKFNGSIGDFDGSMNGLEMTNQLKAEAYAEKKNDVGLKNLLKKYDQLMSEYRAASQDLQGLGRQQGASAESFDIAPGTGFEDSPAAVVLDGGDPGPAPVVEDAFSGAETVPEIEEATDTAPEMKVFEEEGELDGYRAKIDATPTAPEMETEFSGAETVPEMAEISPGSGFKNEEADDMSDSDMHDKPTVPERVAVREQAGDPEIARLWSLGKSALRNIPMDEDHKQILIKDTYWGNAVAANDNNFEAAAKEYHDYIKYWFHFNELLDDEGNYDTRLAKQAVDKGVTQSRIEEQKLRLSAAEELLQYSLLNKGVSSEDMRDRYRARQEGRTPGRAKEYSSEKFQISPEQAGKDGAYGELMSGVMMDPDYKMALKHNDFINVLTNPAFEGNPRGAANEYLMMMESGLENARGKLARNHFHEQIDAANELIEALGDSAVMPGSAGGRRVAAKERAQLDAEPAPFKAPEKEQENDQMFDEVMDKVHLDPDHRAALDNDDFKSYLNDPKYENDPVGAVNSYMSLMMDNLDDGYDKAIKYVDGRVARRQIMSIGNVVDRADAEHEAEQYEAAYALIKALGDSLVMPGSAGGRRVAAKERAQLDAEPAPFKAPEKEQGMETDDVIDTIDSTLEALSMDDWRKIQLYDARFMDAVSESGGDMLQASGLALDEVEGNLEALGVKFAKDGTIDGRSARKFANTDDYKLYVALTDLQQALIQSSTNRRRPGRASMSATAKPFQA